MNRLWLEVTSCTQRFALSAYTLTTRFRKKRATFSIQRQLRGYARKSTNPVSHIVGFGIWKRGGTWSAPSPYIKKRQKNLVQLQKKPHFVVSNVSEDESEYVVQHPPHSPKSSLSPPCLLGTSCGHLDVAVRALGVLS